MIAEGPFPAALAGFDVSFEHDVRAGRNFEIHGHALHQVDAPAREEAAEQQFVETFRHRRGGAVREHRFRAQRHGHFEPLSETLRHAVVLRSAFVPLPVHPGRAAVEDLHAVGADIAHAGLWIFREHQRKGYVSAAVLGPALQDRQRIERPVAIDDFVAGGILYRPRHEIAQAADHRQHLQRVHDACRHLRRHELVDLLREIVERAHTEREAHALVRSVHIRCDRDVVTRRTLEEQRGPSARQLARAVGDGGDLEIRADRLGDAPKQFALVKIREKIIQVCVHAEVA